MWLPCTPTGARDAAKLEQNGNNMWLSYKPWGARAGGKLCGRAEMLAPRHIIAYFQKYVVAL